MQNAYLDAGRITSPHGLRGEVKIEPWADSPAFLCGFNTLYIDGAAVGVQSARVHKNMVIAQLDGVETLDAAELLRGKTVRINRADVPLPDGRFFITDLVGLDAFDDDTGRRLGVIRDILTIDPHNVYVIGGDREILVPAVGEFVRKIDLEARCIRFHLIEGM